MPQALKDRHNDDSPGKSGEFNIEYIGKLAIKVKSNELMSLFNAIELNTPLAEADPQILDWYDFDKIAQATTKTLGVPQEFVKDEKDVLAIREQRAAALKEQSDREFQLEMAKAQKSIPLPLNSENGLQSVTGGLVG